MEVTKYTLNGKTFREIKSRKYRELASLGAEYLRNGARVWMNSFDICAGVWVLTVLETQ